MIPSALCHIFNVAFKQVLSAIQSIPFCTYKGNRKAEQNSRHTDREVKHFGHHGFIYGSPRAWKRKVQVWSDLTSLSVAVIGYELLTPVNVAGANLVISHEPEIKCEITVRNQFENYNRTGSKDGNLLKIA